ncbi:MAG: hypothetical protein L3J22_11645 [Xanthomonadales bacterium]|nr:hypothetical protein [Xanthomonadales bacterium]
MNRSSATNTLNMLKLALLLLTMALPLSVQAGVCEQAKQPNLANTMEAVSRGDPAFTHCKSYVNVVFILWADIACGLEVGAPEGKDKILERIGINQPYKQNNAKDVIYIQAIDMAYANKSLVEIQQKALNTCHGLEQREKQGESINWENIW